VSVQGVNFAYRQLGPDDGVPLILLNHLSAVLDNWDPRVVDGLAARRRVITYDNRGVGASGGSTPDTIEAMASDTVLFIRALGFAQVDLLGLSMGGFIAQVIAAEEPDLVRKRPTRTPYSGCCASTTSHTSPATAAPISSPRSTAR